MNSTYTNEHQAEPISVEMEDHLWKLELLGTSSPSTLLSTLVYMVGLYFSLRSASKHRRLYFSPLQIQLVEEPGSRAYLQYKEDVSKTNQGDLKSQRKNPKDIVHYVNDANPSRCFVCIYKLYLEKCPSDRPSGALYLQPLSKPKQDVWFSKVPCGHNTLQNIVPELIKRAGFTGYFTNHSLRATTATHLFNAGIDEQLIMNCTGYSSTDGVRAYKRMSMQLSEITSDVLNQVPHGKKTKVDGELKDEADGKENEVSTPSQLIFNISGGSNVTIHFTCH